MMGSLVVTYKVNDGASPSGKAPDFDSGIPRFDPWRPSHFKTSYDDSLVAQAHHALRGFFCLCRLLVGGVSFYRFIRI